MNVSTTKSRKRYDHIDALRGIAAVMVMILHIYNAFMRQESIVVGSFGFPRDPFAYFDIGRMGITIFFLISGFVIGRSIKSYQKHPVKTFVIRRLFRLYPLFWFSMIMAIFCVWLPIHRDFGISTILANATMLPAFFEEPFFIGLYWSVETELIFYMLVTALFVITGLRSIRTNIVMTIILFVVAAVFVAMPSVKPQLAHWVATPYHLSLMLLGMTWREYYEGDGAEHQWTFRIHLLMIVAVPFAFIAYYLIVGVDLNLSDSIAYLLGLVIFGLGLYFWRKPGTIFTYLGKISYSIYLLHPVVFQVFLRAYRSEAIVLSHHVIVYLIICSAATFLLAHLSYSFIERPFIQMGRRLSS